MPSLMTQQLRAKRQEETAAKSLVWSGDTATFPADRYSRTSRPATSTKALQRAMMANELVHACIGAKATAAIDPRLVVQKRRTVKGKQQYEEVPGHPMREIIMRPNPYMDEGDLMMAAIASWESTNPRKFFLEKEFTGPRLTGLWPLDPGYMQPLYSRANSRTQIGYAFDDGTRRQEYDFDDLIIREAPAWFDPSSGAAAAGSVEMDSNHINYARTFFLNGGQPSTYLKYKTMQLNQPQRDQIRAMWQAQYGNATGGQHGIGVLDMNMDIQRLGAMLNELNSDGLAKLLETRICMAYGVPPLIIYALIGLERATYANLDEAWQWFWRATMSPLFKRWRTFWTRTLLAEYEDERAIKREDIRLWYDMSQVDALQDNLDAVHERARKDYLARLITKNEGREMTGRDTVPDGDEFYNGPQMQEDRNGL